MVANTNRGDRSGHLSDPLMMLMVTAITVASLWFCLPSRSAIVSVILLSPHWLWNKASCVYQQYICICVSVLWCQIYRARSVHGQKKLQPPSIISGISVHGRDQAGLLLCVRIQSHTTGVSEVGCLDIYLPLHKEVMHGGKGGGEEQGEQGTGAPEQPQKRGEVHDVSLPPQKKQFRNSAAPIPPPFSCALLPVELTDCCLGRKMR